MGRSSEKATECAPGSALMRCAMASRRTRAAAGVVFSGKRNWLTTTFCGTVGGGGGSLPGRMTGGGSIISNGLRVTHGFNLNCDATQSPERLEVNWGGNSFHLEQLNTAFCSNNPSLNAGNPSATFNTYSG